MKSDYYLNRCLEQASLSPLRFRHGCIVVKGGKIIGQGFNDFRPGYDGGALKTGRLPTGSYPPDGVGSELKHPRKGKANNASTPSEAAGVGGGRLANMPLTMHSEMMAINSALSSSSTLAAGTVSSVTPYFKLPRGSKNKSKRLLQKHAVKSYVERAGIEGLPQGLQQRPGTVQGQEWRFEAGTSERGVASEEEALQPPASSSPE
jgi:hypothetical protein